MMRVSWITNLAAPYRIPVWKSIGQHFDLRVKTIVTRKSFNRDAKWRSVDWEGRNHVNHYQQETLRSVRFPWIEYPLNFLTSWSEARDLMRSDIVVLGGWNDPVYWQALILAKMSRQATVGFYESILETQTHRKGSIAYLRSFFFRSLDAIVTPGIAATEAVQAMGVESHKLFQGFNAIDVDSFAGSVTRLSEGEFIGHRFVFVGRLIALKNVDLIIKAFAICAERNDVLTIIGEGECQPILADLVKELGLSSQVFFVGPVGYEQLPDEIVNHNTLILASSTEVWGLVVNEALASGLHVVVSRNCGVSRSVADMKGVFITDNEIESVAKAMGRSREGWEGRIVEPEIKSHTPTEFASCFIRAFDFSTR